jgi:hypothetical protein
MANKGSRQFGAKAEPLAFQGCGLWFICAGALLLGSFGCGDSSRSGPNVGGNWVQITSSGPRARWGHVAVLDPKRRQVVVFGGNGGGSEVWLFSLDSQTWQRVDAANGPPAGWSAGRAIADTQNDRMIVVCGFVNGAAQNSVWSFSFASQTWSQLPTGPSPRFDLDGATDGKHAWFFGGFLPGFIATNELWQFDLTTNSWTLLPAGGNAPSPRTNSSLGVFSSFLYMSGGHDQFGLTAGTWRYDLGAQSWTQLSPSGTAGAGAHFGYDVDQTCGDVILAFGDHDDMMDVSTTDLLSLSSSPQFSRLLANVVPPPRRHAPLILDPQTGTLFTFGGLQGMSTTLGDTWIFRLNGCSQ